MSPETKILKLLKKTGGATKKQICQVLYGRDTTPDKWEGMRLRSLLYQLEYDGEINKDTTQKAFIYSVK